MDAVEAGNPDATGGDSSREQNVRSKKESGKSVSFAADENGSKTVKSSEAADSKQCDFPAGDYQNPKWEREVVPNVPALSTADSTGWTSYGNGETQEEPQELTKNELQDLLEMNQENSVVLDAVENQQQTGAIFSSIPNLAYSQVDEQTGDLQLSPSNLVAHNRDLTVEDILAEPPLDTVSLPIDIHDHFDRGLEDLDSETELGGGNENSLPNSLENLRTELDPEVIRTRRRMQHAMRKGCSTRHTWYR